MSHPYASLPHKNFWKHAVSNKSFTEMEGLYTPKFSLPGGAKVGAAGSCFAQHVRKYFISQGVDILDVEPAPKITFAEFGRLENYGYGIYSARFGNIYTVKQLLQLARESIKGEARTEEEVVWKKGERFYDALRPSIFAAGLPSPEAVMEQRDYHIMRVRQLFRQVEYFIFTFGLTEAWMNSSTALVYPMAPGVLCGEYDADKYVFVNFGYEEIYADFCRFRELVKRLNPSIKFILTVSPVSLAATAEDQHVLLATTYSKSVLRAVAGALVKQFEDVDYFPSYDFLLSPNVRYAFHEPNLREIHPHGVNVVMSYFHAAHPQFFSGKRSKKGEVNDEVLCEEAFLGVQR